MDLFLWLTASEDVLRAIVVICVYGWLIVKGDRVTPERTPHAGR